MSSGHALPILPVGAGYGVVVGIGFFFAIVMAGLSYIQNKYTKYSTQASEEFNTASRSVKSGLIAAGIVSAWTWAATLLQSSTVAYEYGISGPFWYAAGATVQIFMFAVLACKVKQNAPRCHTFLEIIQKRYGTATHLVFIFFALLTNVLVASQLLLGGSAVVTALTGMNVYAAVFLIPLGVCVYVVLGGLRATFLCDYTHTFIVMIIILYFMFSVYTSNALIGSPTAMFDLLKKASIARPVEGNQDGSYLTLKSNYGLIFGVIQLCSGMGTVFLDQGYWQRAIASRPTTAVRAYVMGGMAWFAIPFGFATTLGLAAVALTDNPSYPTYPDNMTASQISSGLSAPFAAVALLGKPGAIALLLTLFMAVTSSSSSELIAVSSILTFDVYKTYMKPHATPQELIRVSHIMICVHRPRMALPGNGTTNRRRVFPAAFAVTWRQQSKWGAMAGAIGGLAAGLIGWLTMAHSQFGELTVASTGSNYPTLAGNMAGVFTGLILTVVITYIKPDNFDWEITRSINLPELSAPPTIASVTDESGPETGSGEEKTVTSDPDPDPAPAPPHATLPTVLHEDLEELEDAAIMEDPTRLKGALRFAYISSSVLTLIMLIIVPVPMFLSHYIFSLTFFKTWVGISFVWVFFALFSCAILPIYEAAGFFRDFWKETTEGFRASKGAKA
ncbi:Urea active transporter [Lachnellula willkommii]|uniref:Urea active transporter n=1 Tax=Lachnellula willkommii TaxID=215461 RepID=A0A559MHG0_9HELO|nr:Urea active transporter [Lachnellula willkommii]